MLMRVDKLLTQLQIASRSESKKLLSAGRLQINGVLVKSGAFKCDPQKDEIRLDGRVLRYEQYQYFMLYKPAGCITATEDPKQKTVMDYLPKERHKDLSPVGRLDKDTEGLLLITDDGQLNHNLLAPGKHVDKTYYARIRGRVTEQEQEAFCLGVDIGEKKPTAPAVLKILSSDLESEIEITITEGKFHQIKRMFQAVGMEVLYLKRLSMGSLKLDKNLKPGEFRELTRDEVEALKG